MINEHKHLITVGQCLALARPTSVHLDEDEVQAYITECEDMHIIPAIGFANFPRLSTRRLTIRSPHLFGWTAGHSLPTATATGARSGVQACARRWRTMYMPRC